MFTNRVPISPTQVPLAAWVPLFFFCARFFCTDADEDRQAMAEGEQIVLKTKCKVEKSLFCFEVLILRGIHTREEFLGYRTSLFYLFLLIENSGE